jgi:1,4-alpha-glucan branching enzyme
LLTQFLSAKKVILAGSFNGWDEENGAMSLTKSGWIFDAFLPIGTYSYKFIVDNEWIPDPLNPDMRKDAGQNANSFLSIGDPVLFQLPGYTNARQVVLAGSFNQWDENAVIMLKGDSGWYLNYVVPAGVYEYRFIVDGNWVSDVSGDLVNPNDRSSNNFKVVNPNYIFKLTDKGYKTVSVSGDFCGWSEVGYPMRKENDEWVLSMHLNKGKVKYKFIVDGKWIIDPGNPDWEDNEFGTGNSVLWVQN